MESRSGFLPKPTTRSIPTHLAAIYPNKGTSKPTKFVATNFAAGESTVKTQILGFTFSIMIS